MGGYGEGFKQWEGQNERMIRKKSGSERRGGERAKNTGKQMPRSGTRGKLGVVLWGWKVHSQSLNSCQSIDRLEIWPFNCLHFLYQIILTDLEICTLCDCVIAFLISEAADPED